MAIKSMLCLVDGGADSEAVLTTAVALARRLDAALEVLHVELDPQYAVPLAADGMTATMIEEVVETVQREGDKRAKHARAVLDKVAQAEGLQVLEPGQGTPGRFHLSFRQQRGREHDVVARRGMLFDLIVLTRRHGQGEPPATPTLETALMESGRPVLVAPAGEHHESGRHVAVAWRASIPGVHAVQGALPLLTASDKVTVITVDDGASGDAQPEEIAHYLAHHGITAQAKHVSARGSDAGDAILAETAESGADMLVMGAYAHSRLRQFIMGGVTSTVLRSASIPLLLAH
jgi:nucleotide-binding universal stress UspA family protein